MMFLVIHYVNNYYANEKTIVIYNSINATKKGIKQGKIYIMVFVYIMCSRRRTVKIQVMEVFA